jgi:hypothetical protein
MRFGRSLVLVGFGALAMAVLPAGMAGALTVSTNCTGNTVVQQAPYTCSGMKTDQGITVNATLTVDANGRAVADFTLTAPTTADVQIALHSWIGIDTGPAIVKTGTIPAGTISGEVVIDQIQCGQLDVKAIDITPGHSAGDIAGPVIHWGNECQSVPTTVPTTISPTSISPTSVSPTSVSPTSVGPPTSDTVSPTSIANSTTTIDTPTTTIPHTGVDVQTPAVWALAAIAAGAALLLVARRWKADSAD